MRNYSEDKLPVWAQLRLSDLRRKIRDLEAAMQDGKRDPRAAPLVVENYGIRPNQALPDDALIILRDLEDDNYKITATPVGDGELGFEVTGVYGGFSRLAVIPIASNVVQVKLVPSK